MMVEIQRNRHAKAENTTHTHAHTRSSLDGESNKGETLGPKEREKF